MNTSYFNPISKSIHTPCYCLYVSSNFFFQKLLKCCYTTIPFCRSFPLFFAFFSKPPILHYPLTNFLPPYV